MAITEKRKLRLGHSPDPDDAFMFYGLASGNVVSDKVEFEHVVEDIESLNLRASRGELEATAVSAHAYALLHDRYRVMCCGASMGMGYGPMVVASRPLGGLEGRRVAVPGRHTTAYLLLALYADGFEPVETRFDRIMDEVAEGRVDAGLIIHEGQLTYESRGLVCELDLAGAWERETGLPLPLGLNVVRRDVGDELQGEVLRLHRESIDYALDHVDEALDYALRFGRGLDRELGRRFVLMYVNDLTRDMGSRGEEALRRLYEKASERGIIGAVPPLDVLR